MPISTSTPASSSLSLLVVVGAAEREPELVREMLTEDLRIGVDLHGELARRREYERARIR